MKLDVVDMTDSLLANSVLGFIGQYTDHIFYLYPQSNGFMRMCQDVASFASGSGVIDVLRIWGHGSNGNQTISAGTDRSDATDNQSGLYRITQDDGTGQWEIASNVDYFAAILKQLGELFTTGGHLELKGCNVASGVDGQAMIREIAKALGRPVQASTVMQTANTVSFNGVGWSGNVMEAQPDGSPDINFVGTPL